MDKVLCCYDVVPGCDAVVRGISDDEILHQASGHAREAHGLQEIDAATAAAARAAIKPAATA